MPRKLTNHKPPLTLLESPLHRVAHSYKNHAVKSMDPCTVKPVQCVRENAKWISVDESLQSFSDVHKKIQRKVRAVKKDKACSKSTKKKSFDQKSPRVTPKLRRHAYGKLDFVNSNDNSHQCKNNGKENVEQSAKTSTKEPVLSKKTEIT